MSMYTAVVCRPGHVGALASLVYKMFLVSFAICLSDYNPLYGQQAYFLSFISLIYMSNRLHSWSSIQATESYLSFFFSLPSQQSDSVSCLGNLYFALYVHINISLSHVQHSLQACKRCSCRRRHLVLPLLSSISLCSGD